VIPIAGDQVTNDIAVAVRTPTPNAEDIKVRYACALQQLASPNDIIEVPGVGDRDSKELESQVLVEVVEARYEELLTLVQEELRRSGYDELCASGIVLTGGSSKIQGVVELAEEVFHMPVRLGEPQNVFGLVDVVRNPIHATGVGLLMYGQKAGGSQLETDLNGGVKEDGVFERMKAWFKQNF